jgi:hypothetical protein
VRSKQLEQSSFVHSLFRESGRLLLGDRRDSINPCVDAQPSRETCLSTTGRSVHLCSLFVVARRAETFQECSGAAVVASIHADPEESVNPARTGSEGLDTNAVGGCESCLFHPLCEPGGHGGAYRELLSFAHSEKSFLPFNDKVECLSSARREWSVSLLECEV